MDLVLFVASCSESRGSGVEGFEVKRFGGLGSRVGVLEFWFEFFWVCCLRVFVLAEVLNIEESVSVSTAGHASDLVFTSSSHASSTIIRMTVGNPSFAFSSDVSSNLVVMMTLKKMVMATSPRP